MKKIFSILVITFSASAAFSATTGTILLQTLVPKKVAISVSAVSISSALDLSTTQADLKVAVVNESSNSNTGYKVTITSANLGKLKRTGGAETFSYSLKYGGATVGLSTTSGSIFTNPATTIVNVNKDLNISYTGLSPETMIEGSYQDTVTLNIASN
jgi:hypothetical protein